MVLYHVLYNLHSETLGNRNGDVQIGPLGIKRG